MQTVNYFTVLFTCTDTDYLLGRISRKSKTSDMQEQLPRLQARSKSSSRSPRLPQPAAAQGSALTLAARQPAVREAAHLQHTYCCETMLVKVKKPSNTQQITDAHAHLGVCMQAAVELERPMGFRH